MESFKQKRANLLNNNPIASHGSWISKHSIAAGSPVHLGGSGKSPLYQDDLKEGELENLSYTDTSSGEFGGEIVPLSGVAKIPGQTVEKFAKPGTPEYDKWKAAVTKDPSIEDKYKDRTVTRERAVDSETKVYPNPFKGRKIYGGVSLDPKVTESDSIPASQITSIFKGADDLPGYKAYLKKYDYKKTNKPPKTKENLSDYTYVVK